MPLVTTAHDGHRRVIVAADRVALTLGLRPGRALAQAQAAVPDLAIADADPEGDTAALGRLAAWCLRHTPLTAPDPPHGVLLDITGCTHLRGGEAALVDDLLGCLSERGYAAHAAVAGTIGAAHALARYAAGERPALVEPGGEEDAVSPLPVAALRLPAGTVGSLHRVGLECVGQLLAAPRAPLARRFGALLLRRLDQATGRTAELLEARFPPETVQRRLAFVEPLSTAEAFTTVIGNLVREVSTALERAGQGARQLDLVFERVDGTAQAVRIGTARASRDARHLGRLLEEKLEDVDPGAGVEAMRLVVPLAEPLTWTQAEGALTPDTPAAAVDLSTLVDRLVNRLGAGRVFRVEPVESDVPERSFRPVPPLGARAGGFWPVSLPRPTRLFTPPQPVDALSALPDHPPAAFTWRGKRRRVRRADGPERICGEWWKRDGEIRAVRDYWAVEDEAGCRYWLFRRGDGADPATGDLSWFLHGLF